MVNRNSACLGLIVLLSLCGMVNAISLSVGVNRSYADEGQSLTLWMNATGGLAPYTYNVFQGSAYIGTVNASANTTMKINPNQVGTLDYYIYTNDSGTNTINGFLSVTVNGLPQLTISPRNYAVLEYSNITFSNTLDGGSPPYKYSYNVTGGTYSIVNNTVTFDSLALYTVQLIVKDALNATSYSQALIEVHYLPSLTNSGNCSTIANFSQSEEQPITLDGVNVTVGEDYITPTYAVVGVGNDTSITLNAIDQYVAAGGYYVALLNLSWLPILHQVTISMCSSNPQSTTTSSSSTTTTSLNTTVASSSSSTSTSTTTVPIGSTTTIANTINQTTTIPLNPAASQPIAWYFLAAFVVVVLIVVYYFYRPIKT